MKRALVCILLVSLAAAGAFSDRLLFLGPGVSYGTESRDALPDWTMTSLGLHMATFSGTTFGLYSNLAMGWILASRSGGVPIEMSLYDMRFSFDMVFGLGYHIPIKGKILAIVGAGLYFGMATMFPEDYIAPTYGGGFPLGPGIQATVTYPIRPGLHLGASLGAGYSLSEPLPLDLENFKNGLHVFGGIGFGM